VPLGVTLSRVLPGTYLVVTLECLQLNELIYLLTYRYYPVVVSESYFKCWAFVRCYQGKVRRLTLPLGRCNSISSQKPKFTRYFFINSLLVSLPSGLPVDEAFKKPKELVRVVN